MLTLILQSNFMKKLIAPIFTLLLLSACGSAPVSTTDRHVTGNTNATLKVEEYADLQCPACAAAHKSVVTPLLEKYGDTIAYEMYHFPLQQIHPFALRAAIAAECAGEQGKYYEFIDIAFENQSDLNAEVLPTWAQEAGVADLDAFNTCRDKNSVKGIVNGDYDRGRELGVTGTPSFFVNGVKVDRNSLSEISNAIDEALGLNIPL
jgi:protein-disulfide isomerase